MGMFGFDPGVHRLFTPARLFPDKIQFGSEGSVQLILTITIFPAFDFVLSRSPLHKLVPSATFWN